LSIIRVNKACAYQRWDQNRYPYARLDRTCVVSTNDTNHSTIVLEARSSQERDWLVFSLKLIVARLASIIITRDEDMLHEFFSPYSALMQLEDDEDSDVAVRVQESLPRDQHDPADASVHGHSLQPQPRAQKPPCAHATQHPLATPSTTSTSTVGAGGSVSSGATNSETRAIECAVRANPGSCPTTVVVMDDGSERYDFPHRQPGDQNGRGVGVDSDDNDNDDGIDIDIDTEDEDEDDLTQTDDDDDGGLFRDRDDSVRARNSGAYAILRRSLTATSPLVEDETCGPSN